MKIIATVALQPQHRATIYNAAPDAEIVDRPCRTQDEVTALVSQGCDVMLTFRTPDDPLRGAPGLKWVQLLSAGADHVLSGPMKATTISLTTASGIHATPIAEYTLASMLSYAHRIHLSIRAQLRHEWLRSGQFMSIIDDLRGRTLGIIGYGSIGRETARLAQAFGMTVLALKRDPHDRKDHGWTPPGLGDPEGTIPQQFFGPGEREEILRESDYVSVTLPLTDHTRKFIGAREFAAIKPGAFVVNIGRGEVIDEAAMIAALKDGKLGGAGLDVFEHEPLPAESPLWDMENVILTPHMSGANRGYMDHACELFADNLRRFAANQPLLNLVDPKWGY
ncbi:MAG: D-2-hydroxyacid dehydrogenase [Candidatus Binatus sp.]|uniref:D-2-hydroxyacid dehydrogenase n=1 Tax=Candidatus Binatus sp. TaxID=2811406 RepID=UPI00271C84D4|nr:D-2-hydroxyacid dehydrogenase [Candidatus Binatus sp.]MDO8433530.1 D-2-hydroxyacid dehydrogenase [Candidatus Binatus sp.]